MGDAVTPELTETERAGWKALGSSYRALAEAAAKGDLTEKDVGATLAQTGQIELDPARFALHVPEDAGAYAEALEGLLRRIPDGWGRWISCDAGWYPLIVDLDAAMAAIWPTYVVQQVKEKFGSLRFYFDAEGLPLEDPRHRRLDALLRDAEERSLRTCEVCGADAVLCRRRGWLKTLCAGCRRLEHNRGYVPVAG
ncbi:hypothetical protein H5399_00415 [Tessaracoccus sp. MC1627]|uniref:hypothetical protein n=1 Tax=Tessaracoccus sp. MC1627 TaxID=2760312 RepID=UPI001602A8A4|nr:hypothetical protein [Tessaracoccus sp. MC1627]MBB1511076.1 hypothetical protein [Tessaracoccus sp. MC1627]